MLSRLNPSRASLPLVALTGWHPVPRRVDRSTGRRHLDLHLRLLPLIAAVILGWVLHAETPPASGVRATNGPSPRIFSAPADAFVLHRIELIPPFPVPRFVPATFPRENPVESVERLAFGTGRLWMTARPAGAGDQYPGFGRLWTYTPAENRLEPVRGVLQTNLVRSILPGSQRVWLNLNTGLASLSIEPFGVDAFGPPEGVTTRNLADMVQLDSGLAVLGRNGVLFTEAPGAGNFLRVPGTSAPVTGTATEPWIHFVTSHDWLLAAGTRQIVVRHSHGSQWVPAGTELSRGSPRLEPITLRTLTGDGDNGFWIGSDAGLHFLNPETGNSESRFAPVGVTVSGGLGVTLAPGFKATPAGQAAARLRVANGIRDRMRQRARSARLSAETHTPINAVTPTSRLPGSVTALFASKTLLWIATTDGANTLRGRVLLFHMPSHRWLGWFPIGSPVRSMAASDRLLWLGLDITRAPGATPLVAIDTFSLVSLPQGRWTPDAIRPEELGSRLASMPPHERAVYAFFSGEPAKVVELLAPEGTAPPDADPETLFLLAFAHDAIGLDRPEKLDGYLAELREKHPDSLYTEIANGVRPTPQPAVSAPVPLVVVPVAGSAVTELLARRDLDGDGRLNTAEFKLWRGPEADLTPFDLNSDGMLDRAELEALLKKGL